MKIPRPLPPSNLLLVTGPALRAKVKQLRDREGDHSIAGSGPITAAVGYSTDTNELLYLSKRYRIGNGKGGLSWLSATSGSIWNDDPLFLLVGTNAKPVRLYDTEDLSRLGFMGGASREEGMDFWDRLSNSMLESVGQWVYRATGTQGATWATGELRPHGHRTWFASTLPGVLRAYYDAQGVMWPALRVYRYRTSQLPSLSLEPPMIWAKVIKTLAEQSDSDPEQLARRLQLGFQLGYVDESLHAQLKKPVAGVLVPDAQVAAAAAEAYVGVQRMNPAR